MPSEVNKKGICRICEEECEFEEDYCCGDDFCLSTDKLSTFVVKVAELEKRTEKIDKSVDMEFGKEREKRIEINKRLDAMEASIALLKQDHINKSEDTDKCINRITSRLDAIDKKYKRITPYVKEVYDDFIKGKIEELEATIKELKKNYEKHSHGGGMV
jgi:archaellum component FlaC